MNQYFKRQKLRHVYRSFGIHPQGKLKRASLKLLEMFCVCVVGVWQREIWTCGVCFWCRSKLHAAKHRLRTQNISSNFSEALFNNP